MPRLRLDFWNNPLVVSAFQLRNRTGNMASALVAYPLFLLMVGIAVPFFVESNKQFLERWPTTAFYVLTFLQFFVSGISASSATSSSMRSEVVKQTLDFQRIASLSPAAILLGKLLGHGAMAFFLAVSTIPLAVLCFAAGGVSLPILILVYVNLFTHTILCGSLGLVTRLELKEDKTVEGGLFSLLAVPLGAVSLVAFAFEGLGRIGWLLACPVVHLIGSYVAFHCMERRLTSPLYPALGKWLSYLLLLLIDGTLAVILMIAPLSLVQRAGAFGAGHFVASLWLTFGVTPRRDTLHSWIWRFRGRETAFRASWLGDRSLNGWALATYCLIGLVLALPCLATAPAARSGPSARLQAGGVLLLSLVLVLTVGTVYQWFMLIFGRGSNTDLFFFLVSMGSVFLAPLLAGLYLEEPLLIGLSPPLQFIGWMEDPRFANTARKVSMEPALLILLFLSGLVWFLSWRSLRLRMRRHEELVDWKLRTMRVLAQSR